MCFAHRSLFLLLALLFLGGVTASRAEETFRYAEKKDSGGELRYVNDIPLLSLGGTPEEIGRQTAVLAVEGAPKLLDYPHELFPGDRKWAELLAAARQLWPHIPADHRAEMDAAIRAAGVDRDTFIASNVMMDVYGRLGCSSLMVEPARSRTGGPLVGRNLDYPGAGYLQNYTLLVVRRPKGKHAFASVGFGGMVGCLSGINDAGLTLAVHQVYISRDGAKPFEPQGIPYAFAFRRVLEECATVDEAEKLMRSIPRTTMLNLALCDRQKAIVLEMTPKSVERRECVDGLCACTNHFRTKPLAMMAACKRYDKLARSQDLSVLGVADVVNKLDEANSGGLTLQTMIFEPRPLILHLAFGSLPASSGPMRAVELKPLLNNEVP
jgi:isopenicillin-N N-acyltransferase like protein